MRWRTMDEIQQETTDWIAYPFLPKGKIVTIDGYEGCGKTFLTLKCCADLSRGRPLFGAPHTNLKDPEIAIYMTAEDGLGDTIKPRLAAMDADMSKIIVLEGPIASEEEEPEPFSLFDFELIEQAIVETRSTLFVIDPAFAFLEDKDPGRTKDCRPLLRRLTEIAERTSCSILLVRHLKKGQEERASHRSSGCVDWAASARSMLLVVEDPEDREKRLIAHAKSNLAQKGRTLRFEIVDMAVTWRGESSLDADDVLKPRASHEDEDGAQSARQAAADFLRHALAGGPTPALELRELAKGADISWSTIKRAKDDLKIKPRPKTGEDGKVSWIWAIPTSRPSWESRDDE